MIGVVRKLEAGRHAADRIYEQLAEAVLKGQLAVGAALPPERELAEQFGVSRTIVRQAVHRLAEIGLVRVKQGGATTVQDSTRATDLRVNELRYRLGPMTEKQRREMAERRMFEGYALVTMAAYRASPECLRGLLERVKLLALASPEDAPQVEREIWTALAEATNNDLYIVQARWWNRIIGERQGPPEPAAIPAAFRVPFLTELLTRMLEGRDAPQFYLEALRPLVLGPPPLRQDGGAL